MKKVRSLVIFLSAFLMWSIPNLAWALYRDDGDEPGEAMAGSTLALVFVGIPVAVAAVVSILVLAPSWFKKNAKEYSSLTPKDPLFIGEDSNRKSITG